MFDSPNPVWLAFNPDIARALNWSHTQDLLFGWLNQEGQPAVWSVWWKDGVYQTRPPRLHETVAEGWAVLGTTKALKQIQTEIGKPLSQYRRIEHSGFENKQRRVSLKQEELQVA